jgi:hypothetical protein
MVQNSEQNPDARELKLINDLSAGDRTFISQLVQELHLNIWWDDYDEQGRNLVTVALPKLEGDGDDDDEVAEEEGRKAVERVLKKYLGAPVLMPENFDEREDEQTQIKIRNWKNKYYNVSNASNDGILLIHRLS